eukprot:scaffold5574_cov162-Ochromonas_danica.AAC.3
MALKKSCQEDGENRIWWMGKCWCEPGWITIKNPKSPLLPICLIPLLKNGDCNCLPESFDDRSFLKNLSWKHPQGYRCTSLCRYSDQLGVPWSSPQEWNENLLWKQLSFYRRELPQTRHNHLRARLDEFAVAFHQYSSLEGLDLGKVLELGAGGYTQARSILERVNATMKEITLVDPLVYHYQSIKGCSYYDGQLVVNNTVFPTTLSNLTIEAFGATLSTQGGLYDTVILMNVIVYAQDALKILETVYSALKPNGLLIFHDRYFDNWIKSSKCKTAGFSVNIQQVSETTLDHFLESAFSREPFFNTNQTKEQIDRSKHWCRWLDDEKGYFVIVHKIKYDILL